MLQQIREIRQIAKAEDKEFEKLKVCTTKVSKNMFIVTADEIGIEIFENIYQVKNIGGDLETRRLAVIAKKNSGAKSLAELEDMIKEIENDIKITGNMKGSEMTVSLPAMSKNILFLINQIIDETIPLIIYYTIGTNQIMRQEWYVCGHYTMTQHISVKAE